MVERKHRIEDALEAVRSAQEEGIVPGGGVTLLRCRDFAIEADNEDQEYGANIVRKSLEAPIRQMAQNSGESEDLILDSVIRANEEQGYDFKSGSLINMVESGVIDPAKVTRVALENSVSAASTLITTSNAIVEE
jgi:chaperonin GroEL